MVTDDPSAVPCETVVVVSFTTRRDLKLAGGYSCRLLGWHEVAIAGLAAKMVVGVGGLEGSCSISFSNGFCRLHRAAQT